MCIMVIGNGYDYFTAFSSDISVNILFQTSVFTTLNLKHGEVPTWHMTLKYIKKLHGCVQHKCTHSQPEVVWLCWQSPPTYWQSPPCMDKVHPHTDTVHPVLTQSTHIPTESTLYWHSPPTYWHVVIPVLNLACQYDFPLTSAPFMLFHNSDIMFWNFFSPSNIRSSVKNIRLNPRSGFCKFLKWQIRPNYSSQNI